jgi:hypothetical protein
MKLLTAICILVLATSASLANPNATRLDITNGKFRVAQSYCAMCADKASSCRIGCNGSGRCIQACDDDYRNCVEQNCRRRY